MQPARNPIRFLIRFLGRLALVLLLLWVVVFPTDTLLHEGGHAAMSLITTRGGVTLNTGFGNPGPDFRLGRLRVHLGLLPGIYGFSHYDAQNVSRTDKALIMLAGPCVSLVLALSFGFALRRGARLRPPLRLLCLLFFLASLFQFLGTVLPVHYPRGMGDYKGWRSDGAAALGYLR